MRPKSNFVVDESLIGSTTRSGSTTPAFNDTETLGASLTINWDINDTMQAKWASTYREIDIRSRWDFDAVGAFLFENTDVDRDFEFGAKFEYNF